MKKYISLYLYNIKVFMMAQMSFRMDFFIGLFSSLIEQIVYLVFLNILFGNIKEIAGFNYGQMLFIYGIATAGRSIHLIFFDNLWLFGSRYIRKGEFERLLLMPVNPLFQLICERIQPQGIGTTLIGILALIQASNELSMEWSFWKLLLLIFITICIGLLYAAIQLGPTALAFWIVESFPLTMGIFSLNQMAQYPLNIYPRLIQFLLIFIFPYAFTAYLPALYFFDLSMWGLALPIVVALIFAINYKLFRYGMTKFTSVGN
ncbi:ABC transporter permease [Streptococcus ruminantium]|uniref:ABC transporter permease n=1 Tax=Streptococcus ruminantium TaxID=1917441 RepID=UPI0012DD3429|nr:ABC-2 family transporter protein [Streptococcus ruminantium]